MPGGPVVSSSPEGIRVASLPGLPGWSFRLRTITTDAGVVVSSIEATAPTGVAITADRFRRIPIGTLLRLAVDPFRAVAAVAANVAPDPAALRAYSPEHLAAVVAVYRAAVSQGAPPREAIANHFDVQRVTVDRWLARARGQGLLGPWSEERAGEVQPPGGWPKTTGRIRRGSDT